MGRYPARVNQTRFGQRSGGVGIVWEKPKYVAVDHYELFISSREVDPTQVEAFCRGNLDFAKKFIFDNTVHAAVDNMTPMFSRMLYSVFAVDKDGNCIGIPFTVNDSKNMNLESPKFLAVEEGPVGIKSPKHIAVEEGPWGLEMAKAAEELSQIDEEKTHFLHLWYDEKTNQFIRLFVPGYEIKALSYKVTDEEKNVVGEIVVNLPLNMLDEAYHKKELCKIEVVMPGVAYITGKAIGFAPEIELKRLSHLLEECKVSSIEVNYDKGPLQLTYRFAGKFKLKLPEK